jgi:hypothetical protein
MASQKDPIRLELTPEQREQIRRTTGKDAQTLELSIQELEERIAPAVKPVVR